MDRIFKTTRRELIAAFFLMLLIPLVWRWTPLYERFNVHTILAWQNSLVHNPLAPLFAIGVYLVAGVLFFPVTILNLTTVIAFGPLLGNLYALAGWMMSSIEGYFIGHLIGRDLLHKLAGPRLEPLVARAENHGFLAVLAMRVVPVGPFMLVNLFVGASGIRFWNFFLASLIGRVPGILILTLFGTQLEMALHKPGLTSLALLVLVIVAVPLISRLSKRFGDRAFR
ncbi:MAG TPA: TVP38/TMEM64 family protein [Terriglobales bacterium]|nr:TVP38/TMEM64 family protein [Terriglobales bacterium]